MRQITICTTLLMFLCFAPVLSAKSTAKIWLVEKVSYKLSPEWTLKSEFTQRFENRNTADGLPSGGAIDEWEEFFAEFGVDYALSPKWVFNGSYRYIQAKKNTPKYTLENRFFVASEYKFKMGILNAGLRTRLIARLFTDSAEDRWKYRVTETFRFSVPTPLEINKNPILFTFYDELHLDIRNKPFNTNEMKVGFKFVINQMLDFDLYYANEIKPAINGVKNTTNICGVEIGLKF
ncbi:MAG: DUF2490 domain-containing protein [Bacteroidales bacterium]